jgi:adenylate cyclase class 2
MEEIEAKFLDVNPEEIETKLKQIGARKTGEYFYKRRIFDYPDLRLHKDAAWLRLRDEGDKITLTYKKRLGFSYDPKINDEGMQEIEMIVEDFNKTGEILEAIGLTEKFFQENKRIRYVKDGVEFDLDFWPQIPPYLEIETDSWEKVDEAAKLLGLDPNTKKICSTTQVYQLYGIEDIEYQRMTFEGFEKKKI